VRQIVRFVGFILGGTTEPEAIGMRLTPKRTVERDGFHDQHHGLSPQHINFE
jgi:hypothetical protein